MSGLNLSTDQGNVDMIGDDYVPYFQRVSISGDDNTGVSYNFFQISLTKDLFNEENTFRLSVFVSNLSVFFPEIFSCGVPFPKCLETKLLAQKN